MNSWSGLPHAASASAATTRAALRNVMIPSKGGCQDPSPARAAIQTQTQNSSCGNLSESPDSARQLEAEVYLAIDLSQTTRAKAAKAAAPRSEKPNLAGVKRPRSASAG